MSFSNGFRYAPLQIVSVINVAQFLKAFFNAEEHGVEHGVPLAALQSGPYREILMAGQNLDLCVFGAMTYKLTMKTYTST